MIFKQQQPNTQQTKKVKNYLGYNKKKEREKLNYSVCLIILIWNKITLSYFKEREKIYFFSHKNINKKSDDKRNFGRDKKTFVILSKRFNDLGVMVLEIDSKSAFLMKHSNNKLNKNFKI